MLLVLQCGGNYVLSLSTGNMEEQRRVYQTYRVAPGPKTRLVAPSNSRLRRPPSVAESSVRTCNTHEKLVWHGCHDSYGGVVVRLREVRSRLPLPTDSRHDSSLSAPSGGVERGPTTTIPSTCSRAVWPSGRVASGGGELSTCDSSVSSHPPHWTLWIPAFHGC